MYVAVWHVIGVVVYGLMFTREVNDSDPNHSKHYIILCDRVRGFQVAVCTFDSKFGPGELWLSLLNRNEIHALSLSIQCLSFFIFQIFYLPFVTDLFYPLRVLANVPKLAVTLRGYNKPGQKRK